MRFDLTRPNTGRMIDYWLGGNHNFEIDRQLADQIGQNHAVVRDQVLVARALVKQGVTYFHQRGIKTILDFGAGLPTCGNTHQVAHALDPNMRVLYSDIDPITVAYGQELVQGNANVLYLHCDAVTPMTILETARVREFLANPERVGIIFLALAHTLSDDQLRAAFQTLHTWAMPGSLMMVSQASDLWKTDPELLAIAAMYQRSNMSGFFRSRAELRDLAQPWQVTVEGVTDYEQWGATPPREPSPRPIGYAMMLIK
jgi:hypothetical protein